MRPSPPNVRGRCDREGHTWRRWELAPQNANGVRAAAQAPRTVGAGADPETATRRRRWSPHRPYDRRDVTRPGPVRCSEPPPAARPRDAAQRRGHPPVDHPARDGGLARARRSASSPSRPASPPGPSAATSRRCRRPASPSTTSRARPRSAGGSTRARSGGSTRRPSPSPSCPPSTSAARSSSASRSRPSDRTSGGRSPSWRRPSAPACAASSTACRTSFRPRRRPRGGATNRSSAPRSAASSTRCCNQRRLDMRYHSRSSRREKEYRIDPYRLVYAEGRSLPVRLRAALRAGAHVRRRTDPAADAARRVLRAGRGPGRGGLPPFARHPPGSPPSGSSWSSPPISPPTWRSGSGIRRRIRGAGAGGSRSSSRWTSATTVRSGAGS